MNRIFGVLIVLAMVGGVTAGWASHEALSAAQAHQVADACGVVTDLFLRLVKMIIAPLVVTTLISGIAHMEDAAAVGRVGAKTLAWFLVGSVLALVIGLVMVRTLQPGADIDLSHAVAGAKAAGLPADAFSLKTFLQHLVPSSVVDAMAKNEILQIVVFSVFFGTAIAATPGRAPALMQVIEQAAAVMLKVTGYVMLFAPLAIFAALTATVASEGIGILWSYAKFIGGYYLALLALWVVLASIGAAVVGGRRGLGLIAAVREPVLLAFSTASSEAAYPSTLERLQAFGVPRRIVSFVLPLGYSFNLVGSMMYCTFAIMFIAQAYRIPLDLGQQITLLLILMVTSKGMAGVPRASLVVVAATIGYFHIPESGLLLILAVDHLMDMGRSATNVVGNSVAAAVVARWEGALGSKAEAEPETEAA